MLLLQQGDITGRIVCTLNEKMTLVDPFFIFVFTNVTTKERVYYYPGKADDESTSTERYNQFSIPLALFDDTQTGQWKYEVFESEVTDTEDTTALNMLENGKMLLEKQTGLTLTGHAPETTYKGYAG